MLFPNIEEREEKNLGHIDMIKYHRLKSMCQDVSDFISENGTPHTSVTITANDFVMREDILNGYLVEME